MVSDARLSFLRRVALLFLFTHTEPQRCDRLGQKCGQLQVRSAARSDHSPLGRKDGHTASGLIHFKLLSLRAVPTRLDPSSAVTLRTVTAHQVLRRHQASQACTEAPVTRDRDTSPTLKEHPSGVHARDKEPSPQGIPARRRRVYLRVSCRGAHLLTECGNRCDQGQAT